VRRTGLAVVAAAAIVAGTLVVGVAPASADSAYLCRGYVACDALGMSSHGYSDKAKKSYWRMYPGHNCTNYAAYLMIKAGRSKTRPWKGNGNANGWGHGVKKSLDKTPAVGAIAWWDAKKNGAGAAGHVAYVEAVISPTQIIVSEDNYGGDFDWRVITTSGSGWPTGFIHFKDAKGAGSVPDLRAKPIATTVWTDATMSKSATVATMKPGTTAWVQLAFQNTGRLPWTGLSIATKNRTAGYVSPFAYEWDSNDAITTQKQASIAPGKTGTFGFAVQIPNEPDATDVSDSFIIVSGAAPVTAVAYGATKVSLTVDSRSSFTYKPTPVIDGTGKQTQTLVATSKAWRPGAVSLTYKWTRDGKTISDAKGVSYVLTDADVGRKVAVTVTGRRAGYLPVSKTSEPTKVVASKFPSTLSIGTRLAGGDELASSNGKYRLIQMKNGLLVTKDRFSGKTLWSGGKKATGVTTTVSASGSLSSYNSAGKLIWTSKTSGKGANRAVIRYDGKLVLLTAKGKTVWTAKK